MQWRKSVFAPSHELPLDDFVPSINYEGGRAKLQLADWSELPDRQLIRLELKQVRDRAIGVLAKTISPHLVAGCGGLVNSGDRNIHGEFVLTGRETG